MSSKASGIEFWLFGKFGPAERAAAAWLRDAVWPEGVLCCVCGRITDGDSLCPSCRLDLQAQGYVFSWDRTELLPGVTVQKSKGGYLHIHLPISLYPLHYFFHI